MRIGPLAPTEIGVLLLASLPWLVGLALAVVGLVLLLRLTRAQERIARSLEGMRGEDRSFRDSSAPP